jgi:RNA polymerase sigma-70 factor (ECF subfamily)
MIHGQTTQLIQGCIDRLRGGDESARKDLIEFVAGRVEWLARIMAGDFPRVKRWLASEDVSQAALLRLHRTLQGMTPDSVPGFLELVSFEIRRELLDLARRYHNWVGESRVQKRPPDRDSGTGREEYDPPDPVNESPSELMIWEEFHKQMQALPTEERVVAELVYYHELKPLEISCLLEIPEYTVDYRWKKARLRLQKAIGPRRAL